MNNSYVLQIPISPEQYRIFFEAAALSGFVGEYKDRDYLLYLLARDLTPIPGHFSPARGKLCQRLKNTPTPAFWQLADQSPSPDTLDGPAPDAAGGKSPEG